MAYKAGRGKHLVQEEYIKQVQVLVNNDVDFLIAEVRLFNISLSSLLYRYPGATALCQLYVRYQRV